jgi:hypothetical protein
MCPQPPWGASPNATASRAPRKLGGLASLGSSPRLEAHTLGARNAARCTSTTDCQATPDRAGGSSPLSPLARWRSTSSPAP